MSTDEPQFQTQQEPLEAIDRLPDPAPKSNRRYKRSARLALVFLSIMGNCLTAGGVMSFSLFAPYIQSRFRLDQAATSTVVAGGLVGTYFSAAPCGLFADRYGPRWTSLLAGMLNLAGYLSFTLLLSQPRHVHPLGLPIQYALACSFVLIGSGTVSSYFCSLKTSTLNFPSHPSVALGVPLAFFGLSGAFLSAIAGGSAFDDGADELDAKKFATFLTVLVSGWNVFSAAGLRVMPSREGEEMLREEDALANGAVREADVVEDEETPLLERVEEGKEAGVGQLVDLSVDRLVREKSFWVLGLVLFSIVGPAEMIVSSLGSLILALLPAPSPNHRAALQVLFQPSVTPFNAPSKSPLQIRQTQVLLFSIFNTLSRLLGGFVADYLSAPLNVVVPHPSPSDRTSRSSRWKRPRMSKTTMLLVVLLPLGGTYLWAAVGGLSDTAYLPVLTVVVGWSYGCIFTLSPSLVAQVFGLKTFGRNFGIQSYFMAASSLLFTFLYGLLAERHRLTSSSDSVNDPLPGGEDDDVKVCRGEGCFQGIMVCAVGATLAGVVGVAWLRKAWRGKT